MKNKLKFNEDKLSQIERAHRDTPNYDIIDNNGQYMGEIEKLRNMVKNGSDFGSISSCHSILIITTDHSCEPVCSTSPLGGNQVDGLPPA